MGDWQKMLSVFPWIGSKPEKIMSKWHVWVEVKSGYGCDREEHGSGLKEPAIKECKATFGDILWPGTQGSVLVFPRLVLDATFDCVWGDSAWSSLPMVGQLFPFQSVQYNVACFQDSDMIPSLDPAGKNFQKLESWLQHVDPWARSTEAQNRQGQTRFQSWSL